MTLADPAPLPSEAVTEHGTPSSTGGSPRNKMADALRRLIDLSVGRVVPDEVWSSSARLLEGVARDLERAAGDRKRPRGAPDATGHPQDFFPTSPMIGFANPLAPPVRVWAVRGDHGRREIRGRALFGYAYEGPPTCVHGGVIAELFDELLGVVNIVAGGMGMTGTLTIKYRKPTPLLADLDLVARQTKMEGRKVFTWGGIFHHDELTAEAEGIFVKLRPEHMLGIVTENVNEARGTVVDEELQRYLDQGIDPPQSGN